MYQITEEKFYTTSRLSHLIKKFSKGICLDAGCGTGEYFKDFKCETLYGIDITTKYLKKIKKNKNKNTKIIAKTADVKKLPFSDNTFDFVFSAAVLEYMRTKKELDAAVVELKRVLKPKGVLVVSTPHKNFFTHFIRKKIISKLLKQNASDPYFVMGKEYEVKDLRKYKFKIHGCLGWVTRRNVNDELLADFLDAVMWQFPVLSGTLIGIYEKK